MTFRLGKTGKKNLPWKKKKKCYRNGEVLIREACEKTTDLKKNIVFGKRWTLDYISLWNVKDVIRSFVLPLRPFTKDTEKKADHLCFLSFSRSWWTDLTKVSLAHKTNQRKSVSVIGIASNGCFQVWKCLRIKDSGFKLCSKTGELAGGKNNNKNKWINEIKGCVWFDTWSLGRVCCWKGRCVTERWAEKTLIRKLKLIYWCA